MTNCFGGPLDGGFYPQGDAERPWLMLTRYGDGDPDGSVSTVYAWIDGRWVYQPTATERARGAVRGERK